MKKLKIGLLILLSSACLFMPVQAETKTSAIVNAEHKITLDDISKEIQFSTNKDLIFDDIIIPENSKITAEIIESQKERRWHKSGFLVLYIKNYTTLSGEKVDLEEEDIYIIARKYKKIKAKDVAITGTEIAATTAADFFVPGVSIAYYFTKGAIKREDNKHWFESGVSTAYENSIFWFWLKGKPMEIKENEKISIKEIDEERAEKLKSQIKKRKYKEKEKAAKYEPTIEERNLKLK